MCKVYLVGILDESEDGGLFGQISDKESQRAVDPPGRRFRRTCLLPKDASEMPAVMAQVAKDLRSQYVVGYSPTNDKKDGTYRTIKVVANPKDNRKLIVRTRQGYTAKGGPSSPTQAATDNSSK